MDDEQKSPSLLKLAVYHDKVASGEWNNRTLNYKEWLESLDKRTTSQERPPGFSSRKVQPSLQLPTLPSSSPKPQTQTGGQLMIKDEPWQGPTELSHDKPRTSAAQDWISPSNKMKILLPCSSRNPNLQTKPPSLRPTPQPNPTPTTNTARLQLPNLSPNQGQGLRLLPKNSIPTRPRSFLKRKAEDNEEPQKLDTPLLCASNGSKMKKSAENLLCHLCQASCSSALTMKQHLNGRQHKAKMEYMKMKRERATSSTTTATITTIGRQGKPRCELCEIWCSDVVALDMHFKGQKHKSKIQKLQLERGGEKSSKAPIICELCRVPVMNQDLFEQHLKGRQHAANQELKNRGFS